MKVNHFKIVSSKQEITANVHFIFKTVFKGAMLMDSKRYAGRFLR